MRSDTLIADVRSHMLETIKKHTTWGGMTEGQQTVVIDACQESAEHIVQECCRIIAERQGKGCVFTRKSISQNAKGQLQVVGTTAFDPEVWSQIGASVLVHVVPMATEGHNAEPGDRYGDVQPDQPGMFTEGPVTDHSKAPEPEPTKPGSIRMERVEDMPEKKAAQKKRVDAVVWVHKGALTQNGIEAVAEQATDLVSLRGEDLGDEAAVKAAIDEIMSRDEFKKAKGYDHAEIMGCMVLPEPKPDAVADADEQAFA